MRPLVIAIALSLCLFSASAQTVVEYPVNYPNQTTAQTGMCHPAPGGSTHEITFDALRGSTMWITGQNYDQVVQVNQNGGMTFYPQPTGSKPHGIEFDAAGHLWVTWEGSGMIVWLDQLSGKPLQTLDVNLPCPSCAGGKLNTHPHGLAVAKDGKTLWFTGKSTGTVGKVVPTTGNVTTYDLPTVGSVPIYVRASSDGTMWVTELVGNAIASIDATGKVTEYPIPTYNSRPIAIVPDPKVPGVMWFSEEAGNRVGRIDPKASPAIVEYPLPLTQSNVILAGLAFDSAGNLWVQQYINQNNPTPANPSPTGGDYVIRIDKAITGITSGDISRVPITYYKVPSTQTIMHRIVQGPDGNIWFTELGVNKVGKLVTTQ